MDEKKTIRFPLRYLIFILTLLCCAGIAVSIIYPEACTMIKEKTDSFLMPLETGLNKIGTDLADRYRLYQELSTCEEENALLKERISELEEQNRTLYQQTYELQELRELLNLEDKYSEYPMTAANVIQKESGNWFHEFIIDKGSDDGIFVDANVLADGALIGRVTYVGKNYSRVLSLIDDESSVGAMSQETGDFCIVSGDLTLYNEGKITFGYADKEAEIAAGNLLVTSNLSDIYLPGLAIGYVDSVQEDANQLTRSGYVVPIADFSNLQKVMVITQSKSEWMQDETETESAAASETTADAAQENAS